MRARPLGSLIALLLAVSVTAMGFAAAVARGQAQPGARVVVLCSGGGLVQVVLDAAGDPTGESHLCPDLAASLLAAHALRVPDVTRPGGVAAALAPAVPRLISFAPRAARRARGPPDAA